MKLLRIETVIPQNGKTNVVHFNGTITEAIDNLSYLNGREILKMVYEDVKVKKNQHFDNDGLLVEEYSAPPADYESQYFLDRSYVCATGGNAIPIRDSREGN